MRAMAVKYDTLTVHIFIRWKRALTAEYNEQNALENNTMATHTKINANIFRVRPADHLSSSCRSTSEEVVEVIRLYTNDYPNIAGQTFAAIVAHIPLHAPHISSTA